MESLTPEQLQRIEENRKKALEIRNKQISKHCPPSSTAANIKTSSYGTFNGKTQKKSAEVCRKSEKSRPIVAELELCSSAKFAVRVAYDEKINNALKGMKSRTYDAATKRWTFPINEHDAVVSTLRKLDATVNALPRNLVNCLKVPLPDPSEVELFGKIDDALLNKLMPFQMEGVKFGISRNGRCLIADDMGLGKTIQALGLAHYYMKDWPLLIVCPSSMRFPWEEAILNFLPSVDAFSIIVLTSASDDFTHHNIIIVSYDLFKNCLPGLKKKRFGFAIFDESHYIKNGASARTEAVLEISKGVSHVVLLSGTPALSRPMELFHQLKVIDPPFFNFFHEFGLRYCAGHQGKFGWDYSGSSNSRELELLLLTRYMIRRMKGDVLRQQMLPKTRNFVDIDVSTNVGQIEGVMEAFAQAMTKQSGLEQRSTLMEWYSTSSAVKVPAVAAYVEEKLKTHSKMLVFAHHTCMMDGISDKLISLRVDFIRIDGRTSADMRSQLCEKFQTDEAFKVAVLSIKAANAGITLTAADLVIFAELFWNPGELIQAEDRAHRIGQSKAVTIEYLMAKGTVDDHLIKIVKNKLTVLASCGLSKDNFPTPTAKPQKKEKSDKKKEERGGKGGSVKEIVQEAETSADVPDASTSMGGLFSVSFNDMDDFNDDDDLCSIDIDEIERDNAKRPRLL